MAELNGNEKRVLKNLSKAHGVGCGWNSAILGTSISSETGARDLLDRFVKWGFASGGPSRFYITEEGGNEALKVELPQKTQELFSQGVLNSK